MVFLFRLFAHFPLRLLHAIGAVVGWLTYLSSSRYRKRWNENRAQAGLSAQQVRGAIAHNGRMLLELPRLWLGAPVPCEWTGEDVVQRAYAAGKGIVFLTPHLGCFEITAQVMAERFSPRYGTLTVLYRPAGERWLAEMMRSVRDRPGLRAVPVTLAGIRQMMRELRQGRAVGLLPDHVPPEGQGLWAPFFGRPAYTMTLAAKLVHQTGAEMVVVWGERLPAGRGYRLHCLPMPEQLSADLQTAVEQINHVMEQLILAAPNQYMWNYARYRQPRALVESADAQAPAADSSAAASFPADHDPAAR